MLHKFLTTNRLDLIDRCRSKVAQRTVPPVTPAELEYGIPLFLDQLTKTLIVEQSAGSLKERLANNKAGLAAHDKAESKEIGASAGLHGRELLQHGFTIDQVVHDYGDLCQAVTELAVEEGAAIEVDEFRTLNRCLDNAIAEAVTEFSSGHGTAAASKGNAATEERLRVFALQAHRHLQAAKLAITAVRAGNVGLRGATGAILDLNLLSLETLIDRTVANKTTH